jgi:membrane-bound serine protease (ClpP class)
VLLTAEVFIAGFGVAGLGGAIAIVLGGLILTGSSETGFQVSRWLIIGFAIVAGAFFLLFAGAMLKMRKMVSAPLDKQKLIGAKGTSRTRLSPTGYVSVAGERWEATAEDPPIEEEAPIVVTATAGLRLVVKRDPASIKALPPAPPPPASVAAE